MVTSLRPTSRSALALLTAAAAGALLTGCDSDPGTAASVAGESLSVERLDAATTAYCDYVAEVGVDAVPRSVVRSGLAELWLYDAALTDAVGPDALELPPAATQIAGEIAATGADGDVAALTVRLLTVSNALADPAVGQVAAEALADLDVTVNPSVGSYADGTISVGGDGVSVAASDAALGASFSLDDPPTPEEVAALPGGQRCGAVAG